MVITKVTAIPIPKDASIFRNSHERTTSQELRKDNIIDKNRTNNNSKNTSYTHFFSPLFAFTTLMMAKTTPIVINPPGAKMKINAGVNPSGKIEIPNTDPFPKISRIVPNKVKDKVNPIPVPIPSNRESKTEF